MKETPTGRTRYRVSWRGKVILQIERAISNVVTNLEVPPMKETIEIIGWRDAVVEDLTVEEKT